MIISFYLFQEKNITFLRRAHCANEGALIRTKLSRFIVSIRQFNNKNPYLAPTKLKTFKLIT